MMYDLHEQVLSIEFQSHDLGEQITVKDYLKRLLLTLWQDGEGFSGKRPFGNGGWQYDLYLPLAKNGVVDGKLDEDGFIEEIDEKAAHTVILGCIQSL